MRALAPFTALVKLACSAGPSLAQPMIRPRFSMIARPEALAPRVLPRFLPLGNHPWLTPAEPARHGCQRIASPHSAGCRIRVLRDR